MAVRGVRSYGGGGVTRLSRHIPAADVHIAASPDPQLNQYSRRKETKHILHPVKKYYQGAMRKEEVVRTKEKVK
uniref:Uncharacterized protein n=1 Tax=Timema shepardi TaxID=629360 RepID=A0A7R9FYW4_TIMSH|nr:unnamed protein product [Timema shepardi]